MSYLASFIGKRILGETLQNKFGSEDPYFEQVPASRISAKPWKKTKKRRKALPPGISEHDGKVLTKVKRRAYRLDMALFSFLGVRFGWSSAIGLIPFAGDAMDAFMALMVLRTCMQVEGGLPSTVKIMMLFNIALDFVVGLVPFAGDMVDALFKANSRNALLLEKHLRAKGQKELRKNGLAIPAVDPSNPHEYDKIDEQDDVLDSSATHGPSRNESRRTRPQETGRHPLPTEPEQARVQQGRSFFGRSKSRPTDLETGIDNGTRASSNRQSSGRY